MARNPAAKSFLLTRLTYAKVTVFTSLSLLIILLAACGTAASSSSPGVITPVTSTSVAAISTLAVSPTRPSIVTTVTNSVTPSIASTPTIAPDASDPIASELLSLSIQTFGNLQSLHLNMEIRQGKVLVSGQQIKQVDGEIAQPDKYQAQVKVGTFLGDFSLPVIGVGGQQYMKNEFGGWGVSNSDQTVNLAVLIDPKVGLAPTLHKLQNVKLLGKDSGISGAGSGLAYHLQGILSGVDIVPLTFNKLGSHDVTMDVWVSANKNDPQILQLYLKEVGTEADANFWVFKFSKFNEPVQITKPQT